MTLRVRQQRGILQRRKVLRFYDPIMFGQLLRGTYLLVSASMVIVTSFDITKLLPPTP